MVKTVKDFEIGTVNIYGVEKMNLADISMELLVGLEKLKFWKNERIRFEKKFPVDPEENRKTREDFKHSIFSLPTVTSTVPHCVSNVGKYGISRGKTALTSVNSSESCLGEITIKPVWDEERKSFVPVKILPVTLSVDHRILSPHDFNLKKAKKIFKSTGWGRLYPEHFKDDECLRVVTKLLSELVQKRLFF